MWPHVVEWCAHAVAGTSGRMRFVRAGASFVAGLVLLGVLLARFGTDGFTLVGLLLGLVVVGASDVFVARDRVWRAALLPLEDHRQPPPAYDRRSAPTAAALNYLAAAVNAARRGSYAQASEFVPRIDPEVLRADERRLVQAVRATVSLALGDMRRAAQIAVTALPTGGSDLDRALGRAVLLDAWGDVRRLRAIDSAWARAGVGRGTGDAMRRLRKLLGLRVAPDTIEALSPTEADGLIDEARAVGDDDLALALTVVARRETTYR